jgi:putative membrane protein
VKGFSALAKVLGLALLVLWAVLAIAPFDRADWLLENMLVFIAVPLLARYGPGLGFDNRTWVCLFLFFVLHLIGAHYTYAEVPIGNWPGGRNHYDRFVHFAYGVLWARPTLDLFAARSRTQGIWAWIMPVLFLSSHGGIYEVIEWLAALQFGGDLGEAYLGTQGDSWDAQKDMLLAAAGAAIGVSGWLLRARRLAA